MVLPCPLVLPWGAAEKTAWQMYLCVQRRQGPVLLQPLLAPTPTLASPGGREAQLQDVPWGVLSSSHCCKEKPKPPPHLLDNKR